MNESFPYFPGQKIERQFTGYNPYQEALWQALDDAYMSRTYGFAHTRMSMPGTSVDVEKFREWQNRVIDRWAEEAKRDPKTRGFKKEDWSHELWLYLYQRMLKANNQYNQGA